MPLSILRWRMSAKATSTRPVKSGRNFNNNSRLNPNLMKNPRRLLIIYFCSGFAALLYQIVWQRWLVFYTGMSTVSISLIVSAFMAGLGLGYLGGGWVSDRNSPIQNLRYFIAAEVGIGLFALMSKPFFYDFLQNSPHFQFDATWYTYALLFVMLLIPTFLMGFSLPVLSKAIRWESVEVQARYIGKLYFANTLGAAVGALITGVFLVKYLGFAQSVWVGVLFNFGCALGGYGLLKVQTQDKKVQVNNEITSKLQWNAPLIGWTLQFAWSGFAALSLELIWFRILEQMVKSVSITFAMLLSVYLSGLALGTWVGAHVRGTLYQTKFRFWQAQMLIYFYTITSIVLLIYGLQYLSFLEPLRAYLERYEPTWSWSSRLMIYGALPSFLLFVPTFLMGASFSWSQQILQDSHAQLGRRLGVLQFANIVGSTLGAWVVVLVGFEHWGTAPTLQVLMIVASVYLLLLNYFLRKRHWDATLIFTFFIFISSLNFVSNNTFWRVLSGLREDSPFYFDEDATGLSVIKGKPRSMQGFLFANGLGQSLLPFEDDPVHVSLGLVPALLHPYPQHIAIIGLGSGGTLMGVSSRPETQRIDCYELMANQSKVLLEYADSTRLNILPGLLQQPTLHLQWKDGRYALRKNTTQQYDIIEADALRPRSAYAGNLYSQEYFELLKSRLKSGGFAVSWHATPRTRQTMMQVFRYVYGNELVLIGTDQPLKYDGEVVKNRALEAERNKLYAMTRLSAVQLMEEQMKDFKVFQNGKIDALEKDVNTDLFPKDEFNL
ncbi:MAG: fused MFS/spermidine synthase [Runella sp.]